MSLYVCIVKPSLRYEYLALNTQLYLAFKLTRNSDCHHQKHLWNLLIPRMRPSIYVKTIYLLLITNNKLSTLSWWVVVGLVSSHLETCYLPGEGRKGETFTVFTRISHYLQWIAESMDLLPLLSPLIENRGLGESYQNSSW